MKRILVIMCLVMLGMLSTCIAASKYDDAMSVYVQCHTSQDRIVDWELYKKDNLDTRNALIKFSMKYSNDESMKPVIKALNDMFSPLWIDYTALERYEVYKSYEISRTKDWDNIPELNTLQPKASGLYAIKEVIDTLCNVMSKRNDTAMDEINKLKGAN